MSEPNLLDPAAMERLLRLGGKKFALEMIELFLDYGAKKVSEARQAQAAGNFVALAAAAHPLKSSSGNVGAARMQALAGLLEQSAKEGKAEMAAVQTGDLERAFAETKVLLETERKRLGSQPV